MSQDADLESAYRGAEYHVLLESGGILLRIGQADPAADARLAASGVAGHWAIVTPFNPHPLRLDAAENQRRLGQMRAELAARGARWWPALSCAPGGGEPREDGVLWCDPSDGDARRIAERYGQAALVHGRLGQPPCLDWIARR